MTRVLRSLPKMPFGKIHYKKEYNYSDGTEHKNVTLRYLSEEVTLDDMSKIYSKFGDNEDYNFSLVSAAGRKNSYVTINTIYQNIK